VKPEETEFIQRGLILAVFALSVRIVGAAILGQGAPFGPDGTGAEAAVFLGGHPYPMHIALLHLFEADTLGLSMASGSLSCVLLWWWGHRVGLGGAGGWLAATVPLAVLPGILSAGDAPAIAVALIGVLISTAGRRWALLGGAVAAVCVTVKPIALPCLVLLLARPNSLVGVMGVLALLRGFVRPLWAPMHDGGLLGTWWVSSSGRPPDAWFGWLVDGAIELASVESWALIWMLLLSAMISVLSLGGTRLRLTGVAPIFAAWMIACMFGGRMETRYLAGAVLVCLPFVGLLLKTRSIVAGAVVVMLWPTAALVTQVADVRAALDKEALVPSVPVISWPTVDARSIFDSCSTEDATHLRNMARQLAAVAPEGSTIITDALPDGREGELFWPLRVLRPDLKFQSR
jgi:hypothetical protein